MAWPKSGTVSVTNGSPVVTGSGTNFFGAAQAGWAFVGPDGRVYEVLTADSATQITLASNYQGATASGQVYALFPTMSLARDLVASVQNLISNYQGIADGPGAGKFAGDVVKQGDEDTGLSWPASNTVALKAGGTEQLRMTGGVASGAAVQSSATDTAEGKLLKLSENGRGAFGLGVVNANAPEITDFAAPPPSGMYRYLGGAAGAADNPDPSAWWGTCLVQKGLDGDTFYLVARTTMDSSKRRVWAGACQPDGSQLGWIELITTAGGQNIGGDFSVGANTLHVDNTNERVGIGITTGLEGSITTADYLNVRRNTDGWLLKHQRTDGSNICGIKSSGHTGSVDLEFLTGDTVRMFIEKGGNVGIGTNTPSYKLHVREQDLATAASVWATHTSFASSALQLNVVRAANPDYSFFQAYSGNLGDKEFQLGGDGLGSSDLGWQGGGADYAEYFEWLDGNPNGEVRTGVAVVLEGDKIRPAQEGETPIGVISANPSVIGDGDIDRWKGKYLKDDFGAYIWEDYETVSWTETVTETEAVQEQATEAQEVTREVIEVVDGQAVKKTVTETVQVPLFDEFPLVDEAGNDLGTHRVPRMIEVQKETTKEVQHSYAADEVPEGVTVPEDAERVTQKRRKLNPEYDPSQPYVPRAERPEWDLVGLMGKLRIRKGQPVAPNWIKMRDVSAEVEEWLLVK